MTLRLTCWSNRVQKTGSGKNMNKTLNSDLISDIKTGCKINMYFIKFVFVFNYGTINIWIMFLVTKWNSRAPRRICCTQLICWLQHSTFKTDDLVSVLTSYLSSAQSIQCCFLSPLPQLAILLFNACCRKSTG